jgi:hypothetical protein
MRNRCLGSERGLRIAERIKILQADNLTLQVVANVLISDSIEMP